MLKNKLKRIVLKIKPTQMPIDTPIEPKAKARPIEAPIPMITEIIVEIAQYLILSIAAIAFSAVCRG